MQVAQLVPHRTTTYLSGLPQYSDQTVRVRQVIYQLASSTFLVSLPHSSCKANVFCPLCLSSHLGAYHCILCSCRLTMGRRHFLLEVSALYPSPMIVRAGSAFLQGPCNGQQESYLIAGSVIHRITFSDHYPEKPPRVRFTSDMFHPNVYR